MDRKSVIGFILIFVIITGYFMLEQRNVKSLEEANRHRQDSIAVVIQDSLAKIPRITPVQTPEDVIVSEAVAGISDSLLSAQRQERFGIFTPALSGEEEIFTVENEKMILTFSNKGGKIKNVELKNYKTWEKKPLILFEGDENHFGISFYNKKRSEINTDSMFFTTSSQSTKIDGEKVEEITFRAEMAEGKYIENIYKIKGNSKLLDYTTNFIGLEEDLYESELFVLDWNTKLRQQEKDIKNERENTSLYYRFWSEDVDYISETSDIEREGIKQPLKWVSHKQKFFNATIIAKENIFTEASLSTKIPGEEDFSYLENTRAQIFLPYNPSNRVNFEMQMFFGPTGYSDLKKLDLDMEEMVPMGSSLLGFINKNLILPVFQFFEGFTSNYAFIILFLSIFIKLILTPLTFKSYKSQAKMKVLKPELDAIKEKHGKDKQKIQMEQMKLYRETGVSMFGGCLPMLLQMPILFAMYRFYPGALELRQQGFLWVDDLSTYDSIYEFGSSIPLYGDHISLLTILMAISTFLYTRMNSQMTPSGAGPMAAQMKTMQYFFPIMMLFFFNNFSAGLTYYYFCYNILSFAQQFIFKHFIIDENKLRASIEARRKKPAKPSRFSKLQQRLEEAKKLQEQQKKGKKR